MKTITISITVPDGVEVQVAQGAPQPAAPASPPVQPGTAPVCPKHGPDKVKPSTKGPGFYCTAHDDSGPRGYCTWSVR